MPGDQAMPPAPAPGTGLARDPVPATAPPRRVVVWQHGQARLQPDGTGLDVHSDTSRLLVRSLTRAQLGLSLMCLALALAVVASLPVLAALLPGVRRITVAGLPLTLIVLGAAIYPVLLAIGWFYSRQAAQLEARLAELADPGDRRLDG
jgi:hypothetical protein